MNVSSLFGPIRKEYCLYFYILSVIYLVSFALALGGAVYLGVVKSKGFEYYITIIAASLLYFLAYLQNRLLYNMCAKTL